MERLLGVALGVCWFAACASPLPMDPGGSRGGGGGNADAGATGIVSGGEAGVPDGGPACAYSTGAAVPSPVDVIIAVDQSASMGEELAGIVANINEHLAAILSREKIDFRVVLVAGDLCIVPPLGAGPAAPACLGSNPPRFFHAPQPVNNSDSLTLLLWTYDGFSRQPNTCNKVARPEVAWRNHVRYGSLKVFVVFSDDDPSSFSASRLGCRDCALHNCPTFADGPADWGGADFATEVHKLEPRGMFGTPEARKWIFHSIVGVPRELAPDEPVTAQSDTCHFSGNNAETAGVEYQKLSRQTRGMRFPSCNADYSPVFQRIAASIVPLACTYRVEQTDVPSIPDFDRVNVLFDPDNGTGPRTILRDDSAPCDAGANGWQLQNGDTEIVLCGDACREVRASASGRISVEVGCRTRVRNNQ